MGSRLKDREVVWGAGLEPELERRQVFKVEPNSPCSKEGRQRDGGAKGVPSSLQVLRVLTLTD